MAVNAQDLAVFVESDIDGGWAGNTDKQVADWGNADSTANSDARVTWSDALQGEGWANAADAMEPLFSILNKTTRALDDAEYQKLERALAQFGNPGGYGFAWGQKGVKGWLQTVFRGDGISQTEIDAFYALIRFLTVFQAGNTTFPGGFYGVSDGDISRARKANGEAQSQGGGGTKGGGR